MSIIVTFGEIMLRLKSCGNERFFQSPKLEATFGGGEANVAVSLAILGQNVSYVSSVPNNPIGNAAIAELRKYGVNTDYLQKQESGRLGIYFLESGACARPSSVIYDRADSCFSYVKPGDFDWSSIFSGAKWFHTTGITPALTQNVADCTLDAVKQAKKMGLTVSVDLNYRKKLWKYGKSAPEIMSEIVKYADVLIANEEDIQQCLGISVPNVDVEKAFVKEDDYKVLANLVKHRFANLQVVAITLRESFSADKNGWSAVLDSSQGFYVSKKYMIENIVDRVGAGDSFAAGLIFELIEGNSDYQKALDFSVAASCLKHTIPGDFNLAQKSEILSLMNGNASGRVVR